MRRYLPLSTDLALLILRLVLAAVLLYHGIPKLMNFGATVGVFEGMKIPAPSLSVFFAILAEVGGGIAMLLGVLVDVFGLLIVIDMLAAILLVHGSKGFDFTQGGWEHPFTVLGIALGLAFAGPGRMSVASSRAPYRGAERRRLG